MRNKEKVIFANMCMVYDDNGNVLVQDRVGEDWSGITFPGGHVEYTESFTDAVIREVFEETGLNISHVQMCGIKQWMEKNGTRYVILCYKTNHFDGDLVSSDEGEIKWVKLDDLRNMKLASGMNHMLRLFLENDISEYCFDEEDGTYRHVLK